MGASLVYLDRPNTKKDTIFGAVQPATPNQLTYKYAGSGMQGWRLNMVSCSPLLLSGSDRRESLICAAWACSGS